MQRKHQIRNEEEVKEDGRDLVGVFKHLPMRRLDFVVDQLSKFAFVELHISQ